MFANFAQNSAHAKLQNSGLNTSELLTYVEKVYYTVRWCRDNVKKEEMERVAPLLVRKGNPSEIIEQMKEMIKYIDLASSLHLNDLIRAVSLAVPADKYTQPDYNIIDIA